jgi:hypothetical protein
MLRCASIASLDVLERVRLRSSIIARLASETFLIGLEKKMEQSQHERILLFNFLALLWRERIEVRVDFYFVTSSATP